MKRLSYFLFVIVCSICTLGSCEDNMPATPEETAIDYVRALEQGNYTKAMELTLLPDSIPTAYYDILSARHKQLAQEFKRKNNNCKISEITCTRKEMQKDSSIANVHLHLNFSNKSKADIVILLVKQDQKWLIK